MKYYSEITKSIYETEKDLKAAEQTAAQKEAERVAALEVAEQKKAQLLAERKNRAKELEDAYKAVDTAIKHRDELLQSFCHDYGAFHMTINGVSRVPSFADFFASFWK